MGIELGSQFDVKTGLPLDSRYIVADTTARDAIPSGVRYIGMPVYVIAAAAEYRLVGGITNSDWAVSGGGIGSISNAGGTPNARGGTISGSSLQLNPADGGNPGLLTASAQTIGGAKSFYDGVTLQNFLQGYTVDVSTPGSNLTLNLPTSLAIGISGATSISGFNEPPESRLFVLFNNTGAVLTLNNEDSVNVATSSRRILTGTGANLLVPIDGSLLIMHDSTVFRWRVIGGSGSGGSSVVPSGTLTKSSGQDFSGDLSAAKAKQTLYIQSNSGEVALSSTPFGNAAPASGIEDVTLIGAHDTNFLTVSYNDANYGCVGPFSKIELFKYKSVTFRWLSYISRWQYVAGVLA